jgi:hypothetical protein
MSEEEPSESEDIVDNGRPLISARTAARMAGVGNRVWPRMAAANGLEAIPTGTDGRQLWRRVDVEALIGGNA